MLNMEANVESWLEPVSERDIFDFVVTELEMVEPTIRKKLDGYGLSYYEVTGFMEREREKKEEVVTTSNAYVLETLRLGSFGLLKLNGGGRLITDLDGMIQKPKAYKEFLKLVDNKNFGRRIGDFKYADHARNLFTILNNKVNSQEPNC